jgi:hypothetical protein
MKGIRESSNISRVTVHHQQQQNQNYLVQIEYQIIVISENFQFPEL